MIYALADGLGHKVIEVLKKPLEVSLLSEDAPKAPPKAVPPPPAYVPPPEVKVEVAVTPEPTVVIAPAEPPAPVVVVPQVVAVGAVCPNYQGVLSRVQPPPQAQGLTGKVVIEFVVEPSGAVGDVAVASSSNRVFNAVATAPYPASLCWAVPKRASSTAIRV